MAIGTLVHIKSYYIIRSDLGNPQILKILTNKNLLAYTLAAEPTRSELRV